MRVHLGALKPWCIPRGSFGCPAWLAEPCGVGTLKLDGKEIQTMKMEKTIPIIVQWGEPFDIGADSITGVNDADCRRGLALVARRGRLDS